MEYGKRIYGTVGNPPFLAAYSLLAIFIGFIAFIHTEKKYLKACYILVIILNAVVIYLTATRGAILAGLAGLMTLSAFFVTAKGKRQKWKLKNAGMTIAVICSVAVAVITITSHKNYSFKQDITLPGLPPCLRITPLRPGSIHGRCPGTGLKKDLCWVGDKKIFWEYIR